MDQLIELLRQIQELAGVGIEALSGAGEGAAPEGGAAPGEGAPPPEAGAAPGEGAPPPEAQPEG